MGELGQGGMGVVYLARQIDLDRIVALKMLLSGVSAETDLTRFRSEALALARLQHPHIVQVYEVGEHQGRPYFSLEFCPGGSLDRKLAGSPLLPREAAELVRVLAGAMHAAHRAGIVHRDLKPANVLLQRDFTAENAERAETGTKPVETDSSPLLSASSAPSAVKLVPKITDFGLARKLDEISRTQTGDVMGTPSYMAPEQARGWKNVGPAADVYALGAILYECLTGRPPFKAATVFDTLTQVVSEDPAAVRQLNARVPLDLETICHRCLLKEPQRRYASARELEEDLQRFLDGEPIRARPVGALERVWKWARRRPAVAGLLAAIVLLTLVAMAIILGLYRQATWDARRAQDAERDANTERDNAQEKEKQARYEKNRADDEKQKAEKLATQERLAREESDSNLRDLGITLAQQEWEQRDLVRAEQALAMVPAAFRPSWEYRHLATVFHRTSLVLRGHSSMVNSVNYSPDGAWIVSAGADGTLRIWDAVRGNLLRVLRGHTHYVQAACFSPDGSRIASAGRDQTVRVWDVASGENRLTLRGHTKNHVYCVCYSPDGSRLASGADDDTVRVWDAASGKQLLCLSGHGGQVRTVCFSPDGSRIASGGWDRTVRVWDAVSGQPRLSLSGHTWLINCVCYSPDGSRIASASGESSLRVWDARSGTELLRLDGHGGSVQGVAYRPDGLRLASAGMDNTVRVWDAASGREVRCLLGHTQGVSSVCYSPDGKGIASGGLFGDNTVRVWNAAVGREAWVLWGHKGGVKGISYSPDGLHLVSGGKDQTVRVWDALQGRSERTLRSAGPVEGVCYSPDGSCIASVGDRTVRVWSVATGRELLCLRGHTEPIQRVCYSPDGSRIASASDSDSIRVWDAVTGRELLCLRDRLMQAWCLCFSPDGARLAAGIGCDVRAWDTRTGKMVLRLPNSTYRVDTVCYSPDGARLISSGHDGVVRVWDAASGRELRRLSGHTRGVNSVCTSPDGSRIVSAGSDSTVRVWNAATGRELLCLRGHHQAVQEVCYSPDGSQIASAGADGTVRVWDCGSRQPVFYLRGHTREVVRVALSEDGSRVLAADDTGKILAWDVRTNHLLADPPTSLPEATGAVQSGGLRVSPFGRLVRVEREVSSQERSHRQEVAEGVVRERSRETHHRTELTSANKEATAFHLERLVLLLSGEEQSEALAQLRRMEGGPADQARVTDFLQGQYRPTQTAERLRLIAACRARQRSMAAAALYVDAFTADPELAEDLSAGHRWEAARQAALAGCGRGSDAGGLTEKERLRWRQQALEWLRGELAVLGKQAVAGTKQEKVAARQRLVAWWYDLVLLAVREAGLPGEEWANWQALWDENESVLRKVGEQDAVNRALLALVEPAQQRGDWPAVAAALDRLRKGEPKQHYHWYRSAIVLAWLGRRDEHQRLCQEMLRQVSASGEASLAERTGKICLLFPDEPSPEAVEAIRRAVKQEPNNPWFLLAAGLAELRTGHWAQVEKMLERQLQRPDSAYLEATACFILALAHHGQGQPEEARAALERGRKVCASKLPPLAHCGSAWPDWLVADLLRREAEALVQTKAVKP
jgi:WD40 repeat protein